MTQYEEKSEKREEKNEKREEDVYDFKEPGIKKRMPSFSKDNNKYKNQIFKNISEFTPVSEFSAGTTQPTLKRSEYKRRNKSLGKAKSKKKSIKIKMGWIQPG